MQQDAYWWLDGVETAITGLNATLRDFARFGQFILNDGKIDGLSVLPEGWVREAGRSLTLVDGTQAAYGYMWWPEPDGAGHFSDGDFAAYGIFGQRLHISPKHGFLIAELCARSKPKADDSVDGLAFARAAVEALEA
ncbi:serine hydrolase domain-containing protein [Acetobacter oeni]|uniref:Uncharacterized protein n=1 Tax=Acetobacter oeni TaxID=304077 RepID=A0A511XQS9_9PROT|nr:serine hydrolase [Acetobacter oeni]MBB3884880.1 CubicO group peptidase (beta-lactamase class C family) [Acetobacter oeni]NHO20831.1 serine hydrolase [Acetobacter oeni]GBR06342.1 hypothetical protein AA21952_1991 [Acetobacter oeni LMG 21952]GEN65321.1 hypothetical protein AOE01nite_35450 [Acetobacter oeni]